jgi:hypothetical protein
MREDLEKGPYATLAIGSRFRHRKVCNLEFFEDSRQQSSIFLVPIVTPMRLFSSARSRRGQRESLADLIASARRPRKALEEVKLFGDKLREPWMAGQ